MQDYRLDISRRRWMKSAGALAGAAAMRGWAPAHAQVSVRMDGHDWPLSAEPGGYFSAEVRGRYEREQDDA